MNVLEADSFFVIKETVNKILVQQRSSLDARHLENEQFKTALLHGFK